MADLSHESTPSQPTEPVHSHPAPVARERCHRGARTGRRADFLLLQRGSPMIRVFVSRRRDCWPIA